jgi:hypothetical protein
VSMEKILHKVITSNPIDRTAATVTKTGQHFEPANAANVKHWEVCPPLKQLPPNLTGRKFGKGMIVMGLLADANGKWVVRCLCGHF